MSGVEFHLSDAGIEALLKSGTIRSAITKAAAAIAENVQSQRIQVGGYKGQHGSIELPIETRMETTDRARGLVVLAHPAGIAVQAKHGALTKAASASGLEVHGQ